MIDPQLDLILSKKWGMVIIKKGKRFRAQEVIPYPLRLSYGSSHKGDPVAGDLYTRQRPVPIGRRFPCIGTGGYAVPLVRLIMGKGRGQGDDFAVVG